MSNNLQRKRKALGLTQAQAAKLVGVTERAYRRYESTAASEPGVKTAIRIADTLGVTDVRELWDAKDAKETSCLDSTTGD